MRRVWIAVLALMLVFQACHNRKEVQREDSVSADVPSAVADTVAEGVGDTVTQTTPSGAVMAQQDSAETVNLRLFTRKQRVIYDSALMIGEWLQGSEHEQYIADGSGRRWDTGDDVSRDEAQVFSWTMDSNLLTVRYDLKLGGLMIRQYVVTFVDDETLVYRDAYGGTFMFDKVPSGFTDHP